LSSFAIASAVVPIMISSHQSSDSFRAICGSKWRLFNQERVSHLCICNPRFNKFASCDMFGW